MKFILFFTLAACSLAHENDHEYMSHVLKVNDRARQTSPVFGVFDTACIVSDAFESGLYYCYGRTEKNVIVKFLCSEEICHFPVITE